jgi:hypothetical protein
MQPASKQMADWLRMILPRKPRKVVAIALANNMARIAWALMMHGEVHRRSPTRRSIGQSRNDTQKTGSTSSRRILVKAPR